MQVILREKQVTFNENDTITHFITGMNIAIQEYLRGIFVIKSEKKEYGVILKR